MILCWTDVQYYTELVDVKWFPICHVQNHSVGAACGAEGGQDFGQFLQWSLLQHSGHLSLIAFVSSVTFELPFQMKKHHNGPVALFEVTVFPLTGPWT